MAGLVDASADVVDVGSHSSDGGSQLFLFGVVDLDDVAVDGHLSEIRAHVVCAKLSHLVFDEPVLVARYCRYREGNYLVELKRLVCRLECSHTFGISAPMHNAIVTSFL